MTTDKAKVGIGMRNPLSQKITGIPSSGIRKFFDIAATMDDVISLGVGEPDFDTPWKVRAEGILSLEKGQTTYTSNAGLQELRDEISAYTERTIGVKYDSGTETLITVGGSEAIDAALRCMIDPGDEVLLPEPSFVSYHPCTIMADGVPKVIPLQNKNQFKLTVEELEEALTPKSKILVLSFPNNPTGAVMTKEDLAPIADFVVKNDLYVLSDEIYSELNYQDKHVSIASFPGMRERTVVINGFSKGFAMTGWRLGWAVGPQLIIEQMLKLHQYAIMCAPTMSQYAAITALKYCAEEVAEMRESYNERRMFLMGEFARLGISCFEPFGAFYLFPSIERFGLSSDEFATRILQEERLAVVPGTAFGASGEGFLRISYAYSMDELKEAMVRLERFINKLEA
jgi:aminotransferase